MSQADDFRQYAVRPIDGPIDSSKTAHRPRAPELRTVRQPPSRIRARPWARLLDRRRELCTRAAGCIIFQLNCCVLGTIYLNMFCRIDYLPCAPAPQLGAACFVVRRVPAGLSRVCFTTLGRSGRAQIDAFFAARGREDPGWRPAGGQPQPKRSPARLRSPLKLRERQLGISGPIASRGAWLWRHTHWRAALRRQSPRHLPDDDAVAPAAFACVHAELIRSSAVSSAHAPPPARPDGCRPGPRRVRGRARPRRPIARITERAEAAGPTASRLVPRLSVPYR